MTLMRSLLGACALGFALWPTWAAPQHPWGRPPGLPATVPDRPPGQPIEPQSDAQTPPPTFRTHVEFVEVPVVATDTRGNVVGDLQADDFVLLDEGTPQPIRAFTKIEIPLARSAAEQVTSAAAISLASDVASSALELQTRLYVLVLDDLHVSTEQTIRVRRAARRFVEEYTSPTDLLAVVMPGGRKDILLGFSHDRGRVLAAIEAFTGQKLRSATYERYLDKRPGGGAALREGRDPSDAERAYRARVSMATLADTARMLSTLQGRRKSVLYFSEGVDYNVSDVMGRIQRSASDVTRAIASAVSAATRGGVTLYAIDPRGLAPAGDEAVEMPMYEERQITDLSEPGRRGEFLQSTLNLRDLAASTGGFAATDANEFDSAFDRIARENSAYYVLGFEPVGRIRSGTYRRLAVRVKRPDIRVISRPGYLVGLDSPEPATRSVENISAALLPVIGRPLPDPGLGIRVQAVPFKKTGSSRTTVHLVVEVEGRAFQAARSDVGLKETIELALLTVDAGGRAANGHQARIALNLRAVDLARVKATGVRWQGTIELDPGHYQLRVAANAVSSVRRGLAIAEIDVPHFGNVASLSGVVFTSLPAVLPVSSGDAPPLTRLRTPPTTVRDFVIGDRITAAFVVYAGSTSGELLMVDSRVDAIGHDVASLPHSAEVVEPAREPSYAQEMTFEFDTSALPPGQYAFRALVARGKGVPIAEKTVPFRLLRPTDHSRAVPH